MDRSWTPRLKLLRLNVLLLVSANIACLHENPVAVDPDLRCVNDYLYTINCTMNIAPSENASDGNSSYWLTFTERVLQNTFACMLTKQPSGRHFCSVKSFDPMADNEDYADIFTDVDVFIIKLCHDRHGGSVTCKVLDDEYTPVTNIKPNAPCCLAVRHNSSRYHFTWKSTYEEFQDFTYLVNSFKYQLHYFERDKKAISHDINTDRTNFSVDEQTFVPDTDYAARVRTSPNQVFFEGQWSDWSPEVHWRTEPAVYPPTNTLVRGLAKKWFIPLCVLAPLVLLMCYAPVKKWRPSSFIPTPAPYFHTLYSDCQGDFKSWVITRGDTADVLEEEPSLQIDTMVKCEDVPEEDRQPPFHHQWTEGSAYSNVFDPVGDASLWGIPYAVSTIAPSAPGSPAEGDSGCWLCVDTPSLETDSPWYCNKYCTLSTLTPSSAFTAEHVDKILPTGENQSGGHWGSIK